MGYASRANKFSSENTKNTRVERRRERKVRLHVPSPTNDAIDNLFGVMFKGLRPITPDERQLAIQQGVDLRSPDVIEAERKELKRIALESIKPKHEPEVQLIRLTDED